MSHYTGVKVVQTSKAVIDALYSEGQVSIDYFDGAGPFYPNMFLVLKNEESNSALAIVDKTRDMIVPLQKNLQASGIKPKNKEQAMALHALMDDSIPLHIMTGRAGTGKTLLSIAAAMQKIEEKKYDKIIITRPMSQVGRYDLGALPGDISEKVNPYLLNYMTNIEQIVGKKAVQDALEQYCIEVIPMQLIRGASFTKAFIIADEVQVLDFHEMLTLGTRVGEGSKIVVMGDLDQRDEKITKEKTGIWKIQEDEKMKGSKLVSSIELLKVERSELAKLFAEVFESK